MSIVANLEELDGFELVPGVRAKPLFGDGAMLNLLEFEPNATVAAHDHPHEQLGLVQKRPGHIGALPLTTRQRVDTPREE